MRGRVVQPDRPDLQVGADLCEVEVALALVTAPAREGERVVELRDERDVVGLEQPGDGQLGQRSAVAADRGIARPGATRGTAFDFPHQAVLTCRLDGVLVDQAPGFEVADPFAPFEVVVEIVGVRLLHIAETENIGDFLEPPLASQVFRPVLCGLPKVSHRLDALRLIAQSKISVAHPLHLILFELRQPAELSRHLALYAKRHGVTVGTARVDCPGGE